MRNIKRIFLISFILLCVTLFAAPVFAMRNEPEGFCDIPWGSTVPKNNLERGTKWVFTETEAERTFNNTTTLYQWMYQQLHDKVIVRGVDMIYMAYLFHDKLGFASVFMIFEGQENFDLLYKSGVADWGNPSREERSQSGEVDKTSYKKSSFL